jgi:hypothetical protein
MRLRKKMCMSFFLFVFDFSKERQLESAKEFVCLQKKAKEKKKKRLKIVDVKGFFPLAKNVAVQWQFDSSVGSSMAVQWQFDSSVGSSMAVQWQFNGSSAVQRCYLLWGAVHHIWVAVRTVTLT